MTTAAIVLGAAAWSGPVIVLALIAIPVLWFGALWLWGRDQPVVTLSPDGLRDIRIAPEFVPWSAIRGLSVWNSGRFGRVMLVTVAPEVEKGLGMSRFARWAHRANAKLGVEGLCVGEQRLKTGVETLFATADAYWKAYRQGR